MLSRMRRRFRGTGRMNARSGDIPLEVTQFLNGLVAFGLAREVWLGHEKEKESEKMVDAEMKPFVTWPESSISCGTVRARIDYRNGASEFHVVSMPKAVDRHTFVLFCNHGVISNMHVKTGPDVRAYITRTMYGNVHFTPDRDVQEDVKGVKVEIQVERVKSK